MEQRTSSNMDQVRTTILLVVDMIKNLRDFYFDCSRSSSCTFFFIVFNFSPLENQAYSNNPNGDGSTGRANPFLPRPVQDRLEKMGIIQQADAMRSTQAIDLKKGQVRNVVAFNLPPLPVLGKQTRKATLTVTVDFKPNGQDKRKLDVKFQACRVVITASPVDFVIPLGIIGPTGWLSTGYIDDTIRITRGHKGSVFVLSRPSQLKKR
jgi:hypothetical protein